MSGIASGAPVGFSVQQHAAGGTVRLLVAGELDLTTVPALIDAIDDALDGSLARLVIDLAGLTFLDCAGLPALLHGRTAAGARSVGFEVCNAAGIPLTVLRLTGVHEYLSVLVV